MTDLLQLTGSSQKMAAFYTAARDFRTQAWPSDDLIYPMGPHENIKTFAEAFSAVQRAYKPYVGIAPGQLSVPWYKGALETLDGPVTFIPLDPAAPQQPVITSDVINAADWRDRYSQASHFHWYGKSNAIGFLGLTFQQIPSFRFWYAHRVVFSHCHIHSVFKDWVYAGKGPQAPSVVIENCDIDTIHNWVRDYGQGLEPKRGGSGSVYVRPEGVNAQTDFVLFLRNHVKHVTGGTHVAAREPKTAAYNVTILGNLFQHCAIGTSLEGNCPQAIVAKNAFLVAPGQKELIDYHCQNTWAVSGGSTWLSWGVSGTNYQHNYVGIGAPNWRLLWMSHPDLYGLQQNKAFHNLIDYAPGTYAMYGQGLSGGAVQNQRHDITSPRLDEFFQVGTILRDDPLSSAFNTTLRSRLHELLLDRIGEEQVGPDFSVLGPCMDWETPPTIPPAPPPQTDLEQQIAELRREVAELPDRIVEKLAAWYNR